MTNHAFRVGDKVRRTASEHLGMIRGDIGTITRLSGASSLVLAEFGTPDGCGTHAYYNFELAAAVAPLPATKDTNPKDAIGDKKVPLWLLSPIAKARWALAQFAGMCKYGAWNWRSAGVRASVYLSAMERHMDAYKSGEELDPVDKTHHLANIMACCAILMDAKEAGKLTDDRPPSVGIRQCYTEVQDQMAALREQYKDMAPKHYTIADTQA